MTKQVFDYDISGQACYSKHHQPHHRISCETHQKGNTVTASSYKLFSDKVMQDKMILISHSSPFAVLFCKNQQLTAVVKE